MFSYGLKMSGHEIVGLPWVCVELQLSDCHFSMILQSEQKMKGNEVTGLNSTSPFSAVMMALNCR